ncbi:MAG: MBL fold metallo-hydrolase [Defluviitaleaceae bacterium]|nr:MBL fold metallo-hydrolase [Defluviitaleaceae bacterium]MCL2836809.1 MBL fold metallo-hydrolase [Defluviitaleaceae bacterium]
MVNINITCLGHSGILIELPELNLIFDYFTDIKIIISPEIFINKKTCVFVSHSHHDHFNKKIFGWRGFGEVVYILDNSCEGPENARVVKVGAGEEAVVFDGAASVRTYGSTDEGVSFLVSVDKLSIFHAGDLNCWYWEDESTPEELIQDEANYLRIINEIAGKHIDIAFIPEDPRLGIHAGRGIRQFREIVNPERIIPIHFPGNEGIKY